ncbi:MAG: hypothetical protein KDC13_01085, partial [Bacteroidetes bacterium]|nr:hypothetical protein [Bacteroidota bacterium]
MIFFISVALIVYVMPVEGKFRYSYVKGKVWLHDDYVAPFDFAINKSKDELNAEKELLLEQSKNYYSYYSAILPEKENSLATELETFTQRLTGIQSDDYLLSDSDRRKIDSKGPEWVKKIYETGLLAHPVKAPPAGHSQLIIVVKNNIAEEKNPDNLFTP